MAQYLPSTPHPNFLDMRRAYGTKISLGPCSFFFGVHGPSPLAQESPRDQYLSRPTDSSNFFLLGPLVSASAVATPPLYGIVCGLVGWNARDSEGYELIFLCFALFTQVVFTLCFPHSLVKVDLLGGCGTQ